MEKKARQIPINTIVLRQNTENVDNEGEDDKTTTCRIS